MNLFIHLTRNHIQALAILIAMLIRPLMRIKDTLEIELLFFCFHVSLISARLYSEWT